MTLDSLAIQGVEGPSRHGPKSATGGAVAGTFWTAAI